MVIIIPAAGRGSRFVEAGYKTPKPLIPARGIPMVRRVADMFPEDMSKLIICSAADEFKIGKAFNLFNRPSTLPINKMTEGAALTVLCAEHYIGDNQEVLIVNSDAIFEFPMLDFLDDVRGYDGGILTFPVDGGPWSYVKEDSSGLIYEVAEKRPISNLATAGAYYFKSWKLLRKAICDMVSEDDRTNGEFYLCPVYNYMIRDGARIKNVTMKAEQFIPLGTPADLEAYNAQLSLA